MPKKLSQSHSKVNLNKVIWWRPYSTHTVFLSLSFSAGESEFDYRVLRLYLYRYHSKFWASMMTIHLFFGYSDVIQKAAILLSILLLYYEESLVSSNLDSNLLRFHGSHPKRDNKETL